MDENHSNIEELQKRIEELSKENEKLKNQISESGSSDSNPYKILAEQSKDGVMIIQDNMIKYVNEGFMALIGYNKEEVIGRSYGDFISEDLFEQLKEKSIRRLNGEDIPSIYSIDFKTKKGKSISCEVNVQIVTLSKKPVLVVGVRDISELVKAKRENEERTQFLKILLDTIPIPVFYKDKDGIYQGGNKSFCQLTGIPCEKLVGASVYDLFPKKLADEYYKADKQIFEHGGMQSYEAKVKNSIGELRDAVLSKDVFRDSEGNIAGLIGVVFDITERKNIARELTSQKKFLESLLKNLPVVLFSIDKEGYFTLSEGAALPIMGMNSGEAVGQNYKDIYKDNPSVMDSLDKALRGERTVEQGYFNNHYFETYFTSIYDQDKSIDGVIGISLDITKRKKAQEEIQKYIHELHESKSMLEKYSAELKEKNKTLEESEKNLIDLNVNKDKFFSIISHDLRSPFSSLIGLSDFMISNFKDIEKEELKESLQSFNRNVRNIYSLLENLLAWSKIQMGRQEIELKEVNLLEVVLSVLSVFNVSIQNKKLEIDKSISKEINVFVDPNMLNTAIRNIISNSIKFTPDEGKISIKAVIDGSYCKLSIEDSGVGMNEEQLEGLFSIEKHQSTIGLQGEKGSGLGLILAKELIEANGGNIKVESTVGGGSTFIISFPYLNVSIL